MLRQERLAVLWRSRLPHDKDGAKHERCANRMSPAKVLGEQYERREERERLSHRGHHNGRPVDRWRQPTTQAQH
eukprot:7376492-Prymnesium_polylepis.2